MALVQTACQLFRGARAGTGNGQGEGSCLLVVPMACKPFPGAAPRVKWAGLCAGPTQLCLQAPHSCLSASHTLPRTPSPSNLPIYWIGLYDLYPFSFIDKSKSCACAPQA